MTGCVSTSPGIHGIYTANIWVRNNTTNASANFNIRLGYFGTFSTPYNGMDANFKQEFVLSIIESLDAKVL